MAYIAEVVGRPGLYLVMSHGGEEIGSIEGINETWRWQLRSEIADARNVLDESQGSGFEGRTDAGS